jgi:hypothetical protein
VLALAVGSATNVASATPTHRNPRMGTIAGTVVLGNSAQREVVKVYNVVGRLVAHRGVRWRDAHFRFHLKPGRYEIKLTLQQGYAGCEELIRVRPRRTTTIVLPGACGSY